MWIDQTCKMSKTAREPGLVVANKSMLTFSLSRMVKPGFNLYLLCFLVFLALIFFISLTVIINSAHMNWLRNANFALQMILLSHCCSVIYLLVFTSHKERGFIKENLRMMPILMCLYKNILT